MMDRSAAPTSCVTSTQGLTDLRDADYQTRDDMVLRYLTFSDGTRNNCVRWQSLVRDGGKASADHRASTCMTGSCGK